MRHELRAWASLTAANLRMLLRNPLASFSLFLVLLVLLGFVKAISGQTVHTRVVVVGDAGSASAAALVAGIRRVPAFDVTRASADEADRQLRQGRADLVITVPAQLGATDGAGRPVPVALPVRYRAGSAGEAALPALRGAVEDFNERVLRQVPPVTLDASGVAGRTTGAIDVLLPGVIAFNIVGGALMLAAGTFAGYKSSGVLRRLKATGIGSSTFVLAHAAASFALGMAQTAAIVVVATLLFAVHLDVPALVVLVALGYLVFLAMGLAIAGWIRDPQRATAAAQAVAFPLIFVALLSAVLPPSVASVTRYLPVAYVTDGLQQLGQGATLGALGGDVLWLLGWSAVLLIAAGRVFRWE
ncbi:MAG TPA: ABC transporter permease [Candidatus Dormibacteraeota bacterium]|nr:ABC transporter permease [Candidatus Dormibacteraeota bacterium]